MAAAISENDLGVNTHLQASSLHFAGLTFRAGADGLAVGSW